jgi:hypothetical protein
LELEVRHRKSIREFAYDVTSALAVHASEAKRVAGKRYQCYCTNGPHSVFLKRGKKRRAHFTHAAGIVVRSDPNRELHDWTRDEIYRSINSRLKEAQPLQIEWRCEQCRSLHRTNLLDLIVGCYRERFTDKQAMRPDLSLHGEADDVRTVIEVVDSNPPDDDRLVYYRMQMMTLIVIPAVKNRTDLFRNGALRASVAKYRCQHSAS